MFLLRGGRAGVRASQFPAPDAAKGSTGNWPVFRAAFRQRRCLIPATGFYEWVRLGKRKQPYHIRLKGGEPFAFAGLWERWQEPGGEPIDSCAIITTEANEPMRPLHNRMPVILDPGDYDPWLDPKFREVDALRALLVP
jgi:putative SOS response-associated peptidase YedK